MKVYFNIHFKTQLGENLQIVISEPKKKDKTYSMFYTHEGLWTCEVDYYSRSLQYHYKIIDEKGNPLKEELVGHQLHFPHNYTEFSIYDFWNLRNYPENYLNNKILKNKMSGFQPEKMTILKKHTHVFRLEAPIYNPNWKIAILGSSNSLGSWNIDTAHIMSQTDYGIWEIPLEIPEYEILQYKYAIYDTNTKKIVDFENGENRFTYPNTQKEVLQIVSDHYFKFKTQQMYHALGVAVPVFSLRSENGFGVGEFIDLKLLADWSKKADLGIIQVLPINDTTANYTWTDSYPYAAISVYALHPQYISIDNLEYSLSQDHLAKYKKEKEELNSFELIDYEKMIAGKWKYIKIIFNQNKQIILKDRNFKKFIKNNDSWLIPYAVFCVLRDLNDTPNFNQWKTYKKYIAGKITPFFSPSHKNYEEVMLHSWVQYQLHLQLKDTVDYIHQLGISIKGDLPIGIYRYSVEAWSEPELFGMNFQAGAPPDQFTDLGQNWEFPTYNWETMKATDYQWWKNRFKALEQYFDAMRIDHILGFFRIWRMPISATQGILGYFYPAIGITEEEFRARKIPFSYERYCQPFINDRILWEYFGENREDIASHFMNNNNGTYTLKEEYNTQRKLSDYFKTNKDWENEKEKIISICANVLFLEEDKDGKKAYHPRFNVYKTLSYNFLTDWEKEEIYDLYNDYFFRRQDHMWYQSAMEKLPVLLNATDMLICGEDLGLVPDCVPILMDELAIVALKVQRMPSENIPFYNPKNATYLNVVTASSHDSSTLRQWWKEDMELTRKYYHEQLMQNGNVPDTLTPTLAEIIMKQHIYNEAMLAIFPIQEFFATEKHLVNTNTDNERINNPAIFPHYWRYRMHIKIENLLKEDKLNTKISDWARDSNRT